jgi:hypothetical protein
MYYNVSICTGFNWFRRVNQWPVVNSKMYIFLKMSPILLMHYSQLLKNSSDRLRAESDLENMPDKAIIQKAGRRSSVFYLRQEV